MQTKQTLERIYHELSAGRISKQDAFAQIQALKRQPLAMAATETLTAVPVWRASTADNPGCTAWTARHVMVLELPGVSPESLEELLAGSRCVVLGRPAEGNLAQRYTDYALACFERIKAILAARPAGTVLLQVVVGEDPEHAVFAGLAALLKTARLENPNFCGQVILSRRDITTAALAQQLEQAQTHAAETVIRYERGTQPLALHWQEQAEVQAEPVFKEHGVYLITGGLGGLGVVFAQAILGQTRHARVILTGRQALAGEKQQRFDALHAQAAGRVHYRALDLGDLGQVESLMADLVREHGSLHGIVHGAGMIADNFILKKTAAEFRQVLAPKVMGTLHLDLATAALELDFFALFSSIASAFGNAGQADYAAANGFLDEFAQLRNTRVAAGERRGRTLAIHWPLWQEGGMRLDAALLAEVERTSGMRPLSTAAGLQAFHRTVAQGRARNLVLEGDLAALQRTVHGTAAAPLPLRAPCAGETLPRQELLDRTQDYLRRQFSTLLKLSPQRIDAQAPLEQYGIDSILAMRLTTQLEQHFGALSKTLLFEYRSIAELASFFVESYTVELQALLAPARGSTATATATASADSAADERAPNRSRLPTPPRRAAEPTAAMLMAEPIAIIGLSGRYPESPDIAAYWNNLRDGKDCIVEVPPERWDWREYFSEDRTQGGRHYSRWGGFIEGVAEFDPQFFNIAPREARQIDPQERLFLQHAWLAIEDAGYTRAALQGRGAGESATAATELAGQVGVYVGMMYSEYQLFAAEASQRGQRMGLTGSFASIANRVSYAFDLHGPSMTLDTMCSSSLTAIHLACQDLRLGRTRLAIAGGVNVTLHPNKYLALSAGQFISGDGHCQSFGEGGDGYIPGEGVGAVLLKRLSEARRDGDHIYGVIRASALNHGGKTNGYTVPNPQAQAGAIAQALAEAKIDPRHISYIEAHGTGTRLGDPIEIAALARAFGKHTQDKQFCLIGSAKSNIGHCESAAGIAGLTKVLLQMRHRQIVPSLHSARLNPHIDFANTPFTVNQSLTEWEAPLVQGRCLPRIAGISSFGAGGSNAHMIVEEYTDAPASPVLALREPVIVVLSARTAEQLQRKAVDLLAFIAAAAAPPDLAAMAYTLQIGREAMEERLGLVVSSIEQLVDKLEGWLAGEDSTDVQLSQVKRHKDALALFSTDADLQQAVERWLSGRKFEKIVELWVKGLDVRWAKLYGATVPQRVSLPGYPFARDHYWLDIAAGAPALASATAMTRSEVLHPLLQANTSDLYQQGYRSTFSGDEAFCSAQRTLCGAAYLEMARAALAHAGLWQGVIELRNTLWAPPVRVGAEVPVCVEVQAGDADRLDYAIYSVSGDEDILHCQGQALILGELAPQRVDIAALQRGASGELLVRLELAAGQQADAQRYVLHPLLLDQALLASCALLPATRAAAAWLPATLDTLRVIRAGTSRMWAWIRHAADSGATVTKLDIDLCDEQGTVCAQLRGLVQEPASAPLQHAAVGAAATVGTEPVWTDRDGIAITAEGDGIYALRIGTEAGVLTAVQAASVIGAVDALRGQASLRVLLLTGTGGNFLRGGADVYNTLLHAGLHTAISEFPYPVIAALPDDATGAGWWLAACCDLLVCSESARYGLADIALYAEPAQLAFLAARFVPLQARQLQSNATWSGAQLQADGWTMTVLPSAEVEKHALLLAVRLAAKPGEALRLLKTHLARELQPLAAALTPIRAEAAARPRSSGDARIIDIDRAEPATVLAQLQQALGAIETSNVFCAIVLASTSSAFVACAKADDVLALQAAIAAAPVPLIAALAGDAQGSGWWLGLHCDACVLSETGRYDAAAICTEAALAARAALDFPQSLGDVLGREVLLSGDAYSGLALKQRAGSLDVVPAEQVLAIALQRAQGFAAQSSVDFALWKRSRAAAAQRAVRALPAWPAPDDATTVAEAGIVALAGNVVSATAQPDGVLLVELHDRDAKNMFSEALVAGVSEVFAHIAQTPYKAVVLTGYDSYFASGGTKESLLAIQAGTARFTDLQLFQLALQCDIPVIAAMQGHAIGAGWSLGLFGDVVLFGEESHYVSPYMGYGFTPGAGATLSVPQQLGMDLARESLFSAHEYTGRELAQRGIAHAVLPRTAVVAAALELAGRIARQPRRVLAGLKQQWAAPLRAAIAPLLQRELAMHEATFVGRADTRALIENRFLAAAATPSPTTAAHAGVADHDALPAVSDTLRRLLAQELQLAAGDIDDDAQFIDLGLDSIVGVTWVRKINERYGLDIEATKVYSHPTLAQLARHVHDEADRRGLLTPRTPLAVATPVTVPLALATAGMARQPTRRSRNAAPRGLRALAATADSAAGASTYQPIAVVGMAGQFPQATNLAQFWRNIAEGRDCISEVPLKRWDMDQFYRAGAAMPGRTNSRWMGLLDDYDLFDPLFFNISPKEAEYMDPQQRLFLQTCWQAIEDAGYNTRSLSGTRCGVFAGCANGDYQQLAPEQRLTAQGFTGNASSILAARISYFFNLQGPCVAIDTACSSSLVAIAQACDSLLSGVSEIALAGGVYVAASPDMHIKTAQAGMLSTDGRCFTFDQRANGFVPGEGVGVVVLKRLADAQRDNDPIYGVIQGWGVNQDGKTNGITAPNPQSQTRLQQDVYDRFHIDPGSIQLIEAHGTGTKLGDPIEVEALKASFGKYTQKTGYCALGSVKSNIGHCLTAAGIAGFIKLMLALKHRQQPPTIQFDTLNEHIDLAQSPFFVNRQLRNWDVPASERRQAAISSFGFSGTNAHIVVAEHAAAPLAAAATEPAIVVLSARTAEQLQQKVRDLLAFIATAETAPDLAALAYTLQVGREAMDERLGLVVVSIAELVKKLGAYLGGETGIADLQLGQAKRHRETLALFSTDPELQQTVDRWLTNRRYGKVVELWVKGFDWDWHKLYAMPPRRISLPTYPFARERYWVAAATPAGVTTAALHPLLHANTSDLFQQSYCSQFSGDEPFCSDKALPAMACLEMARAALNLALRSDDTAAIELRDIAWTSTAPIGTAGPLHIALDALAADNVAFDIYSADGDEEIVQCHGIGVAPGQPAPAPLALAQIGARLPREADERSHRSRDEMLLRLELPAALRDTSDGFVLHPQLLASVHAAAQRLLGGDAAPVALERLRVFGTVPAIGWAWLRHVPQRAVEAGQLALDIDLCDEHGQIAAQLYGLVIEHVATQMAPAPAEAMVPAVATPAIVSAATAGLSTAPARMAPLRIALALNAAPVGAEAIAGPLPMTAPERNKPRGIALVNPRAVVAAELLRHQVARTRPRFALSSTNSVATAATAGEIEVLEQGDGVFSIRIAAGQNTLDKALIDALLRAFEAIRSAESLRVVLLSGSDDSFIRGGNDAYNQALALGLHQAIATFPYPVVALMQGSATGAGWWLASLCDLLLCSEEAQYGYAPADRAMLAMQADFLRERFGSVHAQQLHSPTGYWSGAQLKASGWSCAILPRAHVYNHAQALASQLAVKSALALRLLKAHLARPLSERVAALMPAPASQASHWNGSEAARVIRLDQRDIATVAQQFAEAVAQIEAGAAYRSIVLASDVAPFDGSEVPEQALALQLAIDNANVPVIAALGGDAQGLAWLLALSCDACVLAESGWYGGADFAGSAALSARAAVLLPDVLGLVVGQEMLLTGEQYSGAQLRQRVGALPVQPAGRVLASALELALSWSSPAPDSVIAAKRARVAVAAQQRNARPSWPAASSEVAAPAAGKIALATTVVSATAQANGVLLIEMHDRDAKNMFSEALVAGINEAFAHAASLPYRVVVLSGYDNYFASGGTKESLLAIQAGTAKFTDFKIFQLAQLCDVPVIAAMQGHGVGAGWSLGMFADIVLFGEGSHYVSPYMSYGFTPGAGSTLMVPHKLGHDLARESLLTAHEYVGRELRERGMAQAVLPREQVLADALALAQRIARSPRSRLVNFKQQWTAQLRERIEDTYQRELAMHDETFVGKAETSGHIHARFEQLERTSAPVVAASSPAPRRVAAAAATSSALPVAAHTLASIRARLKESLDAELHMQGRPIDDEEQFIHLGIDSINGVTWMRRINTDFGTGFEATTIYSYPTIRELAAFLHMQLKPAAAAVEAAPALPLQPLPIEIAVDAAPPRKAVVRRSARPQGRLRSSAAARDEADTRIAIVGMSGRYPQAENLDQFWDNLVRGRNSIVEVPASRWNADAYYDRDAKKKDKMASRWLGAMDDIDCFDPLFFRISPEEAEYMDPQHRLFLQESYRAFEDAGYSSQTLSNHHCGVYLGISMNEYAMLLSQHGVMAAPVTGNSYSIAAARIAYYLNLKGPAISVDTACSSSLVALHLACQALRSGEVNMALAGGVSLWLLPESYLSMSQAGMLSPSGQCKAFDDSADGIVMGDGVGALVLKRLADAQADNDVIHGVIIGSGINQDGRTNGITAPSVISQIELERGVYQRYGIDPATISYVEAHGTGTRLGDPIELQALSTVFKERTDRRHYCALASVKSNIGHASSAAGVASVQKVLLSLRHRTLAPTLHVSRENSHFDFANSPFYVNRSAKSWDSSAGEPRRACVNSFGYSGTNAHVVIEEYVADAAPVPPRPAVAQAIPLSARTPEQLRQKVQELLSALQRPAAAELAAVAYTLQVGREAMELRLGFVAASMPQLLEQLRVWLSGERHIDVMFAGEALATDDSEATLRAVELALQRSQPAPLLQAWVSGAEVAWQRLHTGAKPARARLPSYPFAKERYWVEGNKSAPADMAAARQPGELAWIEDILAQVDTDTLEQEQAVAMLRQWV